MRSADLASADLYASVAVVNFADMTLRVALSADLTAFLPVTSLQALADPSWLRSS